MADTDLSALLPVSGGRFAFDAAGVGGKLATALDRCAPGVTSFMTVTSRVEENGSVRLTGTGDILNVSGASVTVIATPVPGADPRIVIRYTLVDGRPTAASWKFSRSFRDLPNFTAGQRVDKSASSTQTLPNTLDTLQIDDAAFVFSTDDAATDPVTGCPLVEGLNFTGKIDPTGLLGMIGSLVTGGGQMRIYGPIVLALPGEVTLPPSNALPSRRLPWRRDPLPPGIHLFVDLSVDKTIASSLRLHDIGLRIYVPVSQAWMNANPDWSPFLAADGKLDVPSAAISLDLVSLSVGSTKNIFLLGVFEGVSLGKLAALADLAGGGDLASHLPDDLQKGLDTIGQLQLLSVSLQLGAGLSLQYASMAVGIPDLNTTVVPGFEVDSVIAEFGVVKPFDSTSRAVSVNLGGRLEFADVPMDVSVSYPQVYAAANLASTVDIPIGKVFTAVGLPDAPGLAVNQLQLEVGQDGSFSVATMIAQDPPWTMDLGPSTLTVKNASAVFTRGGGQAAKARLGGTLMLGDDLALSMAYDTPGNFLARADLPDVRIVELIGKLTNQDLSLPGGFDIALTDNYVLITKRGNDYDFQLATLIEGAGLLVFEARRVTAGGANWGFALGFDMANHALSDLAGLIGIDGLGPFADLFALDKLTLVVASFEDPGFTFPAASAFNAPVLPTTGLQLPGSGVIKGINIFAQWNLGDSQEQSLLRTLLGLHATLGVTLQVGLNPSQDSRLYVSYATTIQGMPFRCEFGGQYKDGHLGLFLTGHLETKIDGKPYIFDVTLLFVENGAFISGSMIGTIDFDIFQLSNLALVIGTNWEGIPSLGVACTLTISDFQSSLAVFFDSADPSRSMLAGSVSDLNMLDVVKSLAGAPIPDELKDFLPIVSLVGTHRFTIDGGLSGDLDNLKLDRVAAAFLPHAGTLPPLPTSASQVLMNVGTPGQSWFLTDLTKMYHYELKRTADGIEVAYNPQFYFAPQRTSIGALRYEQGLFLSTGVELFTVKGEALVSIDTSRGVVVEGSVDKIVILNENLFALESTDKTTGPKISAATFSRAEITDPALSKPHFLLDGSLTFLGTRRDTHVYASMSGFDIEISGSIASVITYDLKGHCGGLTDLSIQGSVGFGIGKLDLGPLGSVSLDTDISGSIHVGVSGSTVSAGIAGTFKVLGQGMDLPEIGFDASVTSLADLPAKAASEIFDLVKEFLLGDAKRWAEFVAKGLVTGVEDVAKVLEDAFNKTADEARQIAEAAGAAIEDAANKVAGCATSTAAALF